MSTNWKYIKKQLEQEFLCDKLRGHITYDLTLYKPAPWYQQHFIVKHDEQVLLEAKQAEFEWDSRSAKFNGRSHRKRQITDKLYEKYDLEQYGVPKDKIYWFVSDAISETLAEISHYNGVFGVKDIIEDIGEFLHSDIKESLSSPSYFVQALAILDRRCGKRTLEKFAKKRWVYAPMWLKDIYRIRFDAEGIQYNGVYERDLLM